MFRSSFLILAFAIFQVQGTYQNYELVQVRTHGTSQRTAALEYIDMANIDAWKIRKDGSMDLLVTLEQASYFRNLGYEVKTMKNGAEIDELIATQKEGSLISTRGPGGYNWDSYNNLTQVYGFFDHISEMHPDQSNVTVLGQSYLGNDIKMITLSDDPSNEDLPIILVDAALHGRDWSAVYVAMDVMHHMIHSYNLSTTATRFSFIPVVNVDGYKYTWESTDRFWRKSRQDVGDEICVGIDPNRNFDVGFGGDGSSDLVCSDYYRGQSAAEEEATAMLKSYMEANIEKIKAYISIHSYGQTIMYPYGYTSADATNVDELAAVAIEANASLNQTSGYEYTVGAVADLYDTKSGTSYDFAQDNGVPYVYAIEVRDTGEYGFLLPEDQLTDNSNEVIAAYLTILEHALSEE